MPEQRTRSSPPARDGPRHGPDQRSPLSPVTQSHRFVALRRGARRDDSTKCEESATASMVGLRGPLLEKHMLVMRLCLLSNLGMRRRLSLSTTRLRRGVVTLGDSRTRTSSVRYRRRAKHSRWLGRTGLPGQDSTVQSQRHSYSPLRGCNHVPPLGWVMAVLHASGRAFGSPVSESTNTCTVSAVANNRSPSLIS